MAQGWKADTSALFERRLDKSAKEWGNFGGKDERPDIWQFANGDVAVIGRDLADVCRRRLPEGVGLGAGERLVIFPGSMLSAAKVEIPDA